MTHQLFPVVAASRRLMFMFFFSSAIPTFLEGRRSLPTLDLPLDPAINLELDRTPACALHSLFATPFECNIRCSE